MAVHEVITLGHLVEQLEDLGRVRLHVIIHTEDVVSVCIIEGSHERVMLAEVAHQIDAVYGRVFFSKACDGPECVVA